MEDEGDVYTIEVDYPSIQTFVITPQLGETFRGVFYPENKQSYVHLGRHESLEDIEKTCEHEGIHAAIYQCIDWEYEEMWNDELTKKWSLTDNNDRKEHNAIRIMLLPEEYFGE